MIKAFMETLQDLAQALWKHYILGAFLLVAAFTGLNMQLFWFFEQNFFWTDTDCYLRALRIIDWLSDFQWSEKIFPWTNPPHGFELHWTRACDIIWATLAAPFMLIMPLKYAVFYGGILFSPLFFALTVIALFWGIKSYVPNTPDKYKIFAVAFLLVLFYLNKLDDTFGFQRPDHHSLMCFVFSFNIAVILRNQIHFCPKEFIYAGIFAGIGMWASSALEGLFVVALILSVLSINWIFYQHPLKNLIYFATGLFGAVSLAWLINPPLHGWNIVDINRLSVVHAVLCGLILLSFLILKQLNLTTKIAKLCGLAIAATISAGLIIGIFGTDSIFVSIYHPLVWKYFVPRIGEMTSLPFAYEYIGIRHYAILFGTLLIAVILYRHKLKTSYAPDLLVLFFATLITAVSVIRFFPYFNVILSVLTALVLFELMTYPFKSPWFGKFLKFTYIAVPVAVLTTFLPLQGTTHMPRMQGPALVDLFEAPELLFNQGVDTVGSPYHTNTEGIIDNYKMWFSSDEDELKALLKKHQVRQIYLRLVLFSEFYQDPFHNLDKLYAKVMLNAEPYPWMEQIGENHYVINYDKF